MYSIVTLVVIIALAAYLGHRIYKTREIMQDVSDWEEEYTPPEDEPTCEGCHGCDPYNEDFGVIQEGTVTIWEGTKNKTYKNALVIHPDTSPLTLITEDGDVVKTTRPFTFTYPLPETAYEAMDDGEGKEKE